MVTKMIVLLILSMLAVSVYGKVTVMKLMCSIMIVITSFIV